MNATSQNTLHLVIGLGIAAILWFCQPQFVNTPKGILLPIQPTASAPIPVDHVQLYQHPPAHYTVVGVVRTTEHFDSVDQNALDKTLKSSLQFARTLAAQAGANGLLITAAGVNSETPSPLDGFVIYAQAINT